MANSSINAAMTVSVKITGVLFIALALSMVMLNGAGMVKTAVLITLGVAIAITILPPLLNLNARWTWTLRPVIAITTALALSGIHAYFA